MSWRVEKTRIGQDLVYDGVEKGIAPSPTTGTANIQNANISTETGEIMASYGRTAQQQTALSNQTLTPDGATNFTGPSTLKAGQWISVSASTVTSISTTTSPSTATVSYLLVGGGGGGGGSSSGNTVGGGGGAGQFLSSSGSVSVQSYAITIGDGGAGGDVGVTGSTGGDTVFTGVATAYGGGGGGKDSVNGVSPSNGGSGGGGGSGATTGGTGATGGNNGGAGQSTTANSAGGGGGAGAVGGAATTTNGGNGGAGLSSSITGTATYYCGGGGGGRDGTGGGTGGQGGGGNACQSSDGPGLPGTANTGGGGGGSGGNSSSTATGGNGGSGIAVITYPLGSMIATGGKVSIIGSNVVHVFTKSGTFNVLSIAKTNLYYVSYKSGTTFKLSAKYDPTGANALAHGTTGSITFSTVTVPNQGVAKSVEKYTTATTTEYRYYVLDANGYVWVYDTAIYTAYGTTWMLPDPTNYSSYTLTGLGALDGQLLAVGKGFVVGKPTLDLGRLFTSLYNVYLNEPFPTHTNFAIVGKQGKLYYCDGNYIGEIFPTTSLITSIANIQSTCSYTASSQTGTISYVANGSLPFSPDGTRIPAVFFTDVYGTQPSNLTTYDIYYVSMDTGANTFKVYATSTSTTAINLATGAAGNQFLTTFWPYNLNTGNGGTNPTLQATTQRVNLPADETAQRLVEIGNYVLIGCNGNTVYPWNQVDATPSDLIALPEADVKAMVNVNNMAYIFAGNKGNIYISNNSVASLALKVPDYCAGIAGTPLTYIEPVFTWGDADYVRGRVYFSILDQTATKVGNCGGVWSFVPSQNMYIGQDVGSSLRLENQNSYGTYSGYCNLIIGNQQQNVTSPQYWTVWQDSYSAGTSNFGIDQTASTPVTQYILETDMVPTGTFLDKHTFNQLEYKLTTPLASGDSIQMYYRLNSTDSWTSCGTVREETSNKIAGYYDQVFQKTQWVQFRAVITTGGTTSSSFVRLKEIRLR